MNIEVKSDTFPIKRNFADALIAWGATLVGGGWMSERGGSLSHRYALGFVITRKGADLAHLADADLICVERWDFDAEQVIVRGKGEPSPHAFIHALVCQERATAIFTFVADAPKAVERAGKEGWPSTKQSAHASARAMADDVTTILGKGNRVLIRGTGLLTFGCTADDAAAAMG